jgi:hypothetical protein
MTKTNPTPKPEGAIKIIPLTSSKPEKTVKIKAKLDSK